MDLKAFELSVCAIADILSSRQQVLWLFNSDDKERHAEIVHDLGVSPSVATDAVAILKGTKALNGDPLNEFIFVSGLVMKTIGFNEDAVQALIVWYAYIVFIPDHIERFGHAPVNMKAVLDYAFEQGSFPTETY